ncbi:hypothetical protein JTE90_018224 [Oedothorax gibbosus]|uniref:DUF4806 domain-containing protein n=1 Tax=Oedothorax gibbosus TaxID=931172 RepID=A0AAV6U9D4_9ARAC|nr:hypothetical protein JTE90_018224 [Oedothorax gibbosus]
MVHVGATFKRGEKKIDALVQAKRHPLMLEGFGHSKVGILYQSTALRVVLTKLQGIGEKQAQVLSLLRQQAQDVCLPVTSDDLPVHFMEDLKLLDEKLADDAEFAKLVKILGFRGRKDIADSTRKVLSGLMATGLARQLNWRGGQLKTSITDTPLVLQLIFDNVSSTK